MERYKSIQSRLKIKSFEKINNEFTLCKCYIHALGKNRNFSHISKENVAKNLSSIFNIPIVANIREVSDVKFVGSHDAELVVDEDGYYIRDVTIPFGVVPFQDETTLCFEDVTEEDGSVVTYLVGNIILWTGRYPDIIDLKYSDEVYYYQSMEVVPEKTAPLKEDKNYTDLVDFTYSALCLLGKSDNPEQNFEPCFPSSRVEPLKYDNNNFVNLMRELKKELSSCFNFEKKGEKNVEINKELIDSICLEQEIQADSLDFDALAFTDVDKLKQAIANFAIVSKEKSAFATANQKYEAIQGALKDTVIYNEDGDVILTARHYLRDFDDNYAYVFRYMWTPESRSETFGRKGYSFDEKSFSVTVGDDFEAVITTYLTEAEYAKVLDQKAAEDAKLVDLASEFETYKEGYSTPNDDVEALRIFKKSVELSVKENEYDCCLSEFEDISSTEEYLSVNEDKMSYQTVESLRDKLIYIRGLHSKPLKKTDPARQPIKVPFGKVGGEEAEPYGGIFLNYKKSN